MRQVLAVDGHVHFYPDMDLAALLGFAAKNISALVGQAAVPCLLLTETARAHVFAALRDGRRQIPGWSIECPADPAALIARRGDISIIVIAGRQIVTAEKIEVLALACDAQIPDGATLADTLTQVGDTGALPVLPWGLGKWIGRRGTLVTGQAQSVGGDIFLGDNKGRPIGWPAPRVFRNAIVLPGTDPLPIKGSESHVGSFGFLLEGGLDMTRPAEALVARLRGLRQQPEVFGRRTTPVSALREQWALRQGKREGAAA